MLHTFLDCDWFGYMRNIFRILYHVMRADFFERIRSYGFLALLLFTIFLTYLFIPDTHAIQIAGLNLGGYRAVYNSAWIGAMTTLLMGEFFLLFSFYLLKGSVERDRRTGVGQILAATPMTKALYTLSKWLSNVAVATTMTFAIFAASTLLQFLRADDLHFDLWALAFPFIIVLFPALAVIAATAVLFDCLPFLSGGLGSVLFFFIAYPILTLSLDLPGNAILYPSIYAACAAQFTGCNPMRQIDAGMPPLDGFPFFYYGGIIWTPAILFSRLALILIAALIALLAAWFFHRFDPAKAKKSILSRVSLKQKPATQTASSAETASIARQPVHLNALTPATRATTVFKLAGLFNAELRLIIKGTHWLWILLASGLFLAQAFAPINIAHIHLLPLAFVLPLTFWSNLGIRAVKHRTEQIIFSTPYSIMYQLPITWLAGIFLGIALTFPLLIRLSLAEDWAAVGGLLVGALFVPSLALALGCWSGNSKLFEGSYLFGWYIASMYSIPALDFMGRIPAAREQGISLMYLFASIGLFIISWLGRRQALK